jgi:hypothetical protein
MTDKRVEDNIDTNGFPYVYGLPQSVYYQMTTPTSEFEANSMISDLKSLLQDMELQKEIERLQGTEDTAWRISVLTKTRYINQQIRLLTACRNEFQSKRAESKPAPKPSPSPEMGVLKDLGLKVQAAHDNHKALAKHCHEITMKLDNTKSVLIGLMIAISRDELKEFYEVNRDALETIGRDYNFRYKSISMK